MKPINQGIGKGLSALLGEIADKARDIEEKRDINKISIENIIPGRFQPRQFFDTEKMQALVDSIKRNGVLQPIVVRKHDEAIYEIIAGERRWRAAKEAGLPSLPVIIIECSDNEALEIGLIENLQRDDLNAIDEAEAFLKLQQDYGRTQEEIALAVSKSRSYVANQIRLLQLPENIKELVRAKKISAGHARNLINTPHADDIVEKILQNGLNVRQTEELRQQSKKPTLDIDNPYQTDLDTIAAQLQEKLHLKTKITMSKTGGSITFYFYSYEQLDDIIHKLTDD